MAELMAAANQWASRPADERFWNLKELYHHLDERTSMAEPFKMNAHDIRAVVSNDRLKLVGTKGVEATPTHWSFTQLSTIADFPAGFIRKLPPRLAAEVVNNQISNLPQDEVQVLLHKSPGNANNSIRAFSKEYARIWNIDIVASLLPLMNRGWMVPPARPFGGDSRSKIAGVEDIIPGQENFGLSVKVGDKIAPAGIYEGDKDMFIFLVHPERVIDDGGKGMMRGVFIWNSEVGASSFKIQTFLVENVCGNHICWNASQVKKVKLVHRGQKVNNYRQHMDEILRPSLEEDKPIHEMIAKAKNFILGKNKQEVQDFLYKKNRTLNLTQKEIGGAWEYAEKWEHTALAPPNTAWGFVHGLTRYSQTYQNADERHALDVIGGDILAMAG